MSELFNTIFLNNEHITLIMGQSPPSSTYNNEGKGLPFLQGKAEFGDIYPIPEIYCNKPIKVAKKGDILLSVRAPVGQVNIAPFDCCIGRGLAAIRPNKVQIDDIYLFYYLKRFGHRLENISSGSTFKAIKKSDIENFKISLPPLPTQKKIAGILSTGDRAIQKVDEAIEKTQRLKKGVMHRLLTKGIGHTEFKDTEIGRIPKEWGVVRIKDIGRTITGKTPSTKNKSFWHNEILFITPFDIRESKYVSDTERKISNNWPEINRYLLPKNSITVVCIGSTIGKVAITSKESVTNQQINSVICGENITPNYLYYSLLLKTNYIKSYSGVAAVPIINKSLFENLSIALPSIDEQNNIVNVLNLFDDRLEKLRIKKQKLQRIKQGLMNELLTGKREVRV